MSRRDVIRLAQDAPVITPLITRCVAEIEARQVRWLWPRRIARGKLTVLAGHPGLGKSALALEIAAIVTSGSSWPVDGAAAEKGSAIILSAEDDPADTIRPRLEAAGADLTRCHIIEAAQEIDNSGKPRRRGFSLVDDITRLDSELRRLSDVALVIIDPVTAYLGKTDSHHNAEVRAVLAPLGELAAQHGVAMLLISHLRKSVAGDAVLQVTGSLAFAAAGRAVYIVARDPGDEMRRLLVPAKNNVGDDRTGFAYWIEPARLVGEIETCRIAWGPDLVTTTADEALAPHDPKPRSRKRDAAAEWLRELLACGPVAVKKLRDEAKAAGYSWTTLRRAGETLGTTTEKIDFEGGWAWRLPDDDVDRPAEAIEL
jgi:hypothetical protein